MIARALAAAVLALALGAAPARAGSYEVLSCGGAPDGENNAWTLARSSADRLLDATNCPPGAGAYDGLRVYDALGGQNAPSGARAEYRFAAPAGARIVRWRYQRYLGKDGDNDWQVYARAGPVALDTCTIPLGAPSCHAGAAGYNAAGSARDARELDATLLTIGVECAARNGETCATGGLSIHRVWAALYSSAVTIEETAQPSLGAASGSLLAGGWLSGARTLAFAAGDAVGVAQTRVLVDGVVRSSRSHACDFTFAIPCGAVPSAAHTIDTASLPDGTHDVAWSAIDAAGNERRSATARIAVDNAPPDVWIGAPAGPTQSREVHVSWSGTDAGAGIAGFDVEVSVDGGPFSRWLEGTQTTGANYAPAPGHRYRFRVRAVDGSGKSSEATSGELVASAAPADEGTGDAATGGGDATPPSGGGADPGGSPGGDPAPGGAEPRVASALAVRSVRLRGRRLLVTGRLARGATGTVVVHARAPGAPLARRAARVRDGRFSVALRLRAPARRLRLRAVYRGDRAHLPASASLAVRAARR